MLVTMVLGALIVQGLFHVLGWIPSGVRPTRADVFSSVRVNYKLVLNVLGLALFLGLFALTARRGVTDPICGMKVDRAKAVKIRRGMQTFYFCCEGCRDTFEARA
jgi:YHS domain-containing protein